MENFRITKFLNENKTLKITVVALWSCALVAWLGYFIGKAAAYLLQ